MAIDDTIKEGTGKLSKTYREVAEEFVAGVKAKSENPELLGDFGPAFLFAEHLDSFPTLSPQLQMMAMSKAREVDMEFCRELIDALVEVMGQEPGMEKAKEIALRVNMRHIRKDIPRVEGTEANASELHEKVDEVIENGPPTGEEEVVAGEAMCGTCSHPEYLHHEEELGLHCSANAEAPVADCDCPGFKTPDEASEPVS